MRGQTCVRRPDRLPARFGMRLIDGHGMRPQEYGPRCLAKRVQGATCVRRSALLSLANYEHVKRCQTKLSM